MGKLIVLYTGCLHNGNYDAYDCVCQWYKRQHFDDGYWGKDFYGWSTCGVQRLRQQQEMMQEKW